MTAYALLREGSIEAEHNGGAIVPWWSFGKTAIAATALALVRDGLLSLDDVVPDRPFTLRQLLSHQAGLPDYGDLPEYHAAVRDGSTPWSVEEMLRRTDADRLRYAPGAGWHYSNIGYLYIERLVEAVTHERFADVLQRAVLQALGIEGARFARTPDELDDVLVGNAAGYDPGWVYHGLLVGSLRDAVLLLDRLMTGDFLSSGLMGAMLTRYFVAGAVPGRPWLTYGYGLGLMNCTVGGGSSVVGHTGGGPASQIAVYHVPGVLPHLSCGIFTLGDDLGRPEREAVRRLMAACAH